MPANSRWDFNSGFKGLIQADFQFQMSHSETSQWILQVSLHLVQDYRHRTRLYIWIQLKNYIAFSFYSKTNQTHNISNLFYFGTTLYMFRTVFPSIIRSLRLYIQHHTIQVLWLLDSNDAVCTVLDS